MKEMEKITVKVFDKLPVEAEMIRTEVFVKEQGFNKEFDEKDGISVHIVMYDAAAPAAVCRVYHSDKRDCYVIGRIAVLKKYRGKNIGSEILKAAEKEILNRNGDTAELAAQTRAETFYEKNGYSVLDETFDDEDCPHVWMRKKLK